MSRASAAARWSIAILLLTASAGAGQAADDGPELKKAWKRAGHTISRAATETGHAFRDVAKTASHTVKDAAKDVDASSREARKDAAVEGRSFWGDAKQGLANALDGFSNALGRLMDGSDD